MENCAYHPDRDAVGACVSCGKLVCDECKTVLGGRIYCNPCAERQFAAKLETGVARAETSASTPTNTSGQGSLAVIPGEIRGWNWGAFFLGWIWGIGNSVWIALLALLPFVGFIMNIVLGIKGNEWAWRNKKWDSVASFKTTQRTWAIVGLVLLIPYFIGMFGVLAAVVIPNVGRFIGAGEEEARLTELANIQVAVHALMVDNELPTLPNPVTIATNDMSAFPDTSVCGREKIADTNGNPYDYGKDKDGYILYQHDLNGDRTQNNLVNYVATQTTTYWYSVDAAGTVTQSTTGY